MTVLQPSAGHLHGVGFHQDYFALREEGGYEKPKMATAWVGKEG